MVLTDLQNKAMKQIRNWYLTFHIKKKPYYVLAGIAGSGKSTLVSYLIDDLAIEEVVTATYTGMAASVLMKKGNENSSTIHRLIYDTKVIEDSKTKKKSFITELKPKESLNHIDLIIIDEYSMVPDKMLDDILSFEKPVLFLGDPCQLPPIFGDNRLEYDFFLDEPHRQALDNPILLIANYARNGEFDKIRLGTYGDTVRVLSRLDFDEDCIFKSDQIICGKNATVRDLNLFYRSEFLGFQDNLIRSDEKIMCLANNWELDNGKGFSLVNGLIGRASNIRVKNKTKIYELDFTPNGIDMFKNVVVDKLSFEDKALDRKTELLRLPLIDAVGKLNDFIYAYAITTHKSQGSEFPYVTFFPEMLDKKNYYRLFYTGVTRASEKLDIII